MPFCSECGVKLKDGAKFCSGCGTQVANGWSTTQVTKEHSDTTNNKTSKQKNSFLNELSEMIDTGVKIVEDSTKQLVTPLNSEQVVQEQSADLFVSNSPAKTNSSSPPVSSNNLTRQQVYAGILLKCPNCGAVITQTTAVCPECGHHITGQAATSSVHTFCEQLMAIESSRKKPGLATLFSETADLADQKKLSLIRSFPIPNSVDDIVEFIMLAIANIDVGLSKNTMMNRYQSWGRAGDKRSEIPKTISDAWISKMQQAYQKAQLTFPNEPAFTNVRQIYLDKMKELKIKVD